MIYPELNLNLKLPTHLMYVLVKNLGQNQSHQFQNQFLSSNSKLCNTIICSIFCPNTLIDNKEITSVLNDSWVFLGECRSENNPRFVTEGYNYYCFYWDFSCCLIVFCRVAFMWMNDQNFIVQLFLSAWKMPVASEFCLCH